METTTEMSTGMTDASVSTTAADATSETTAGNCPMATQQEVQVDNGVGTLHGTLLLPDGCAPYPIAILHVGSGPTDRDGNSPLLEGMNNSLQYLAQDLQARGIASLRYDKRGIAASAGAIDPDVTKLRFEHYADDLGLWIDYVRNDSEQFGDITLVGHSEGALIAPVASTATPPDRVVSLAGAGRPAADILREQVAGIFTGDLLTEAHTIIDELEQGNLVQTVSPELMQLFAPSVQPYMISWFAYDPAQVLANLPHPVLIAAGTTDIQIPVSDADILAAANPAAEVCIIEGMNHVLKHATLDPESQAQAYSDPERPVVPELVDCLATFILADGA